MLKDSLKSLIIFPLTYNLGAWQNYVLNFHIYETLAETEQVLQNCL